MEKIALQLEYDALNAFDAENNVEPPRVIAERIALKWSSYLKPGMVDDISRAIADAGDIGKRRGALELALHAARWDINHKSDGLE